MSRIGVCSIFFSGESTMDELKSMHDANDVFTMKNNVKLGGGGHYRKIRCRSISLR
jgi:hypothetical protein